MRERVDRRPTLAEIARLAHTSVPTVSKVLNGRSDVSGAMRANIMRIAGEIGYRAPGVRRHTGEPPTGLVDLVISGVEGSWANRALAGVERAAYAAGLDVVITIADARGEEWLGRLLARRSRGAVLALVPVSTEQRAALAAAEVPIVLLDPMTRSPQTATVGAANWAGGRAAAEHLLGLGHSRLAAIGARAEHLYSTARLDGFRSAADVAGAPEPVVRHTDGSQADAERIADALLRSPTRPTAIFACADSLALGVLRAASRLGIRVPDDLSIVGFDDLPEAAWTTPALTTVRQPIAEMGEAALRMLLRLQSRDHVVVPSEELATELVVRASTAAPPVR